MGKRKDLEKKEQIKEVETKLKDYSRKQVSQVLRKLETSYEGLNQVEADERIEKYGKNIIDSANQTTLFDRIKDAIINPFNVVLLVVAIVTYITDITLSQDKSYATFLMLIFIVCISSIISFVQTESSNNAQKKLQKMIENKIDVIRNDTITEINIEDVVPGDIVKFSSGDMIPGDVRFIETKDLFLDESQLTGESNPIEKFVDGDDTKNILELKNIGFMGTNIVSGSAKGIVLATGNYTYFGSMSKSLSSDNPKSIFERNIDEISSLLIKFMIIMIPIIFIANFVTKSNWLDALMFGITIAVGLMPEMLPVIITSSLAKGAVMMSKKKTIVKRLGSIQTFGEMDILCTDKTGTLTEDEIILEKYMNATGKEDLRILKHAFLNSYFQTGLKNQMDIAIINRAEKEDMGILKEKYEREDEIPFDFSRRRMSVVLRDDNGKRQLITKGAVDEIIASCKYIELDGKVEEINKELIENAKKIVEENNNEGIRVIAVAQKNEIHGINVFSTEDEKNMVLIGFVGFLDPPKKSAKTAINKLKRFGVKTKVLTGDSEGVAINICQKIGIDTEQTLNGSQIDNLTDDEIKKMLNKVNVYSKLTPFQKKRIVRLFQEEGHVVGYMGDGINDGPPLKQADVGISVDTAVDIAKEVADIILLEKDLNVLEEGVIEGRRTFTNIMKYLKMAISGNFGNMISVVIASIFIPFLPLKPIHILVQNILNDFAQIGMPFDAVEEVYIAKPKKWTMEGLKNFMFLFGFLSTVLDIICFIVMWYVFKFNTMEKAELFQCGWFMFGVLSQTLVIYTIRTKKVPFINSLPSKQLLVSTISVIVLTLIIGFTSIATIFDMSVMQKGFGIALALLLILYTVLAQIVKRIYIKINKVWM